MLFAFFDLLKPEIMKRDLLFALLFLFAPFYIIAQQIHEIDYDQPGVDNAEFVEIRLASSDNPAHFRMTLYNGATQSSYETVLLNDADVTCTTVGPFQYCVWDPSGNNNIQNGDPDGLSLYNINTTTLIEFLSYEGTFTASGGDANGVGSTDIGVSESNSTGADLSLQREEDGANWFGPSGATPGGPNDIPAPVTLTSFTAKPMDANSVALKWSTASEENNEYFSIEHSTNGRDFMELEHIAGAGTTYETQHYQFMHKEAKNSSNYYRLRQVDFDGTFSFSEIKVVVLKDQSGISVRPTLAQQNIEVSINRGLDNDGTIEVVNWNGQIVARNIYPAKNTKITLDVSDLESGHYIVKINTGYEIKSSRFVKF